jgi:hypothetical protein
MADEGRYLVDADTGEILGDSEGVDADALAEAWLFHHGMEQKLNREINDLVGERNAHRQLMAQEEAKLIELNVPTGTFLADGQVFVAEGARGRTIVNRLAADKHREELADLGLRTETPAPPPPPSVRYGTVTAFRAAELDLAKRGLRLAELLNTPPAPTPVLQVVEKEGE